MGWELRGEAVRDLRLEAQIVEDVTAVVANTLENNGSFSCVLGSRLVLDALTELGLPAEVVGTTLYVLDPEAAVGRVGVGLQVGGTGGRGVARGREGFLRSRRRMCQRRRG